MPTSCTARPRFFLVACAYLLSQFCKPSHIPVIDSHPNEISLASVPSKRSRAYRNDITYSKAVPDMRGKMNSSAVEGFGRHLGKPDASGFPYD